MVAISLYKGNLHKVPDVPRKWPMPTPQISVKDFKILLRRRSRALSRLPSTTTSRPDATPNPSDTNHNENNGETDTAKIREEEEEEEEEEEKRTAEGGKEGDVVEGVGNGIGSDGGDCLGKIEGHAVDIKPEIGRDDVALEIELNVVEEEEKAEEVPVNPKNETIIHEDAESDKDKRKREVEEQLKILREKKHNLVQVLKQIQSAEEELKNRSSTQGMAVRPAVPLQVDIPNDTGSMTRLNTPRMCSDGILGGEMEGGEHDGMLNHNTDARQLLRMSSISPSPSSDSQHKKPTFNVIPHPARTTLGVSSSPSRFAPSGQQGQTLNLPAVSVSGTNYVASSPSPAASGGTSVFRENRIPSPWN